MTRRVLMCEPVHYRIDYEINPWMRRSRPADGPRALAQWRTLRDRLEALGVAVETVEQGPDTPDMTFTANAGIVAGGRFLPSNFRHPERRPEEDRFVRWFRGRGYAIEAIHRPHRWEGEGDVLADGEGRAFAGWRFRTDEPALDHLEAALGLELVRLELADERFYHLDTCLAPLGGGRALYAPAGFTAEGRALLARHFGDLIEVDGEEALRFACNALPVGRRVVLNDGCPRTGRALAERGYEAVPVPTGEFLKAGGSVKCLVLTLDSFGDGEG